MDRYCERKIMEYLDMYDENRCPLGFKRSRAEPYRPGEYHLIVHVCLMNKRGEMLIQQRSDRVSRWPGLWDLTIGGHVLAGEEPRHAVTREMREELGLELSTANARIICRRMENRFDDTYVVSTEDIMNCSSEEDLQGKIVLQEEEVMAVRWASLKDVMDMIGDGRFLGYDTEFVKKLFTAD
ncbi:MAG TPA: NUDIX hydrolase [Lachnospiraceae bacterium]|nr:NUDIX hydrolase [Lachnospiraceae bacterium]